MKRVLACAVVALAVPTVAVAQGDPSPYAGQEALDIKALSEEQATAYLEGQGMGYARAAELNHYPGPRHVLELADALGLDADQIGRVEEIHRAMKSRAVDLGAAIVERERALDGLFAGGAADVAGVNERVEEIARLEGALRGVHLAAHVETRAVLTDTQTARYDHLRGYRSDPSDQTHDEGHH